MSRSPGMFTVDRIGGTVTVRLRLRTGAVNRSDREPRFHIDPGTVGRPFRLGGTRLKDDRSRGAKGRTTVAAEPRRRVSDSG